VNKILSLIEKVDVFPNLKEERENYSFSKTILKKLSNSLLNYKELKNSLDNSVVFFDKNINDTYSLKIGRIREIIPSLKETIGETKYIVHNRDQIGAKLNNIDERLKDFKNSFKDEWKFNIEKKYNQYQPFQLISEKLNLKGRNEIVSNLNKLINYKEQPPKDSQSVNNLSSITKKLDEIIYDLDLPDTVTSFLNRAIKGMATLNEYENIEIKNWIQNNQEIKEMLRLQL
jgi:hypothetical protein